MGKVIKIYSAQSKQQQQHNNPYKIELTPLDTIIAPTNCELPKVTHFQVKDIINNDSLKIQVQDNSLTPTISTITIPNILQTDFIYTEQLYYQDRLVSHVNKFNYVIGTPDIKAIKQKLLTKTLVFDGTISVPLILTTATYQSSIHTRHSLVISDLSLVMKDRLHTATLTPIRINYDNIRKLIESTHPVYTTDGQAHDASIITLQKELNVLMNTYSTHNYMYELFPPITIFSKDIQAQTSTTEANVALFEFKFELIRYILIKTLQNVYLHTNDSYETLRISNPHTGATE